MGGEGVHIVETRIFKSSCLLIGFHSWSVDLSITNSHTNNPDSERGKNWSKTMNKEQQKAKKTNSFTPCHLSSFPSDPLHGSKLVFFVFLEVFATVSVQTISVAHFLCFLFSCFLGSGEKFWPRQTYIGTAFTPPHVILMSSLSYWFWLLSHQRKCTVKNSSTLSPTSSGTPLVWCFIGMPRFWFLMFKGLARILQTWNH